MSEITAEHDIFVVEGQCGEYSDRMNWLVCWYDNEAAARDHAVAAKKEADRIKSSGDVNRFDPHYMWDYTGTDYTVIAVPRGGRQ